MPTELDLLKLRLNSLENLLINENILERLKELERFKNSARDGGEGYYPNKRWEKELSAVKKKISTLKK